MAIIQNPDTEYSRELAKWNTPKQQGGLAPNGFQPYPSMVYKAFARENGKVMCGDPLAAVGDAIGEAFSRSCQLVVNDAEGLDKAIRDGWSRGPDIAIEKYEQDMRNVADVTARRHFSDQSMGELAKKEAVLADNASERYLQ